MEQGARNEDFPTIRSIVGNFFQMLKNVSKPEDAEEGKLPDELTKTLNRIDGMEKTVRVGKSEAKVIGKNSFNKRPNFSREKSKSVVKAEIKRGSVLEEHTYENEIEK